MGPKVEVGLTVDLGQSTSGIRNCRPTFLTLFSASVTKSAVKEFWTDIKRITSLPLWLTVDAAYTCYVAVMGVFAYWGPQVC